VAPGEEGAWEFLGEPLRGVKTVEEYAPEEFLDEDRVRQGERRAFPALVPDGIAHQGVDVRMEVHVGAEGLDDINSWTNAGEIMLEMSAEMMSDDGKREAAETLFQEAIHCLQQSIELDPEGENASSLRARALIGVVAGTIEAAKKAS